MSTKIFFPVCLVLFLALGATPLQAQVSQVFNQYSTQPDVWRPAQQSAPGVDAKGDLNLSIPVLTVPGRGGLDYEIRLNYTSGIRYDQRGSWVGTGWTFDPGSITRDPHGIVAKDGTSEVAHNVDYTAVPKWQPDAYYVTLPTGSSMMTRFSTLSGGTTASAPSRSTTSGFYINNWRPWKVDVETLTPVTVGGVATSVTLPAGGTTNKEDYSKFIITAEDGTRYIFAHPTLSTYNGLQPNNDGESIEYYVSAWRLVAILGPDYPTNNIPGGSEPGSWIKFTYTTVQTATNSLDPHIAKYKIQSSYLSEILTPTHKAVFTTGSRSAENFADFEAAAGIYKSLASVKLYSRDYAVSDANVVNGVQFAYADEFEHAQVGTGTPRLALKEIKFLGKGNVSTDPGYKFEYFAKEGTATGSSKTDYFGFYDTVGGNTGFDTSTTDGKSWSLKTIIYPSGGFDVIEYNNDEIKSGETIPFGHYDIAPGGSIGSSTFSFSASGYRQGGARVTKVTRNDGKGQTFDNLYQYGYGHASGVPTKYWERHYTGVFFALTERNHAAVYYENVTQTNPDGSKITTHYTGPYGSYLSTVKTIETARWMRGTNGGFTLAQGNQDWSWGKPYKMEYKDNVGRIVQETTRTYDLSAVKLAGAWANPSEVNVVWAYADKVNQETMTDKGESGSYAVMKTTTYTHHTGGTTGTGFVKKAEETYNDNKKRVTEYLYGYEQYTDLNTRNILTPVIRTDVGEVTSTGTISNWLTSRITNWKGYSVLFVDAYYTIWKPYQTYAWEPTNATATTTTKPAVSSWSSTPGSVWQLKSSVTAYDKHGLPTTETDARGNTTTLTYNTKGQLTKVQKGGLAVEFTYDLYSGLLATVKDENLNTTTYTYDAYWRLYQVRDRFGNLVAQHAYTFPRSSDGKLVSTSANSVKTTTYTGSTPSSYEAITFFDGLGQEIQQQVKNGTSYVVTATVHNAGSSTAAAKTRVYKPYTYATSGAYDASYDARAVSAYGTGSKPYTETFYKRDGLGRAGTITPPYTTTATSVQKVYGVGGLSKSTSAPYYSYVETTDESGKKTREYVDSFGQQRQMIAGLGTPAEAITTLTYDFTNAVMQVSDPRSYLTTYVYDKQGRLRQKTSVDAGTVKYLYDAADNLRYSQDANQASAGKVLYTQYDPFNRPTITGEAVATFSTLIPGTTASFESTTTNWLSVNHYGDVSPKPSTSTFPWSTFSTQIGASTTTVGNPMAHRTANAYKSAGTWQLSMFSYDDEERHDKKYIYTANTGATTVNTSVSTTLAFTYNWQDQMLTRVATVGSQSFSQGYAYDGRGLLQTVKAGPGTTPPTTADVTYAYNHAGLVSSVGYQGNTAVPYTYHIRDWVWQIGNPASTTYPFSAAYTYENNGNVKDADFYNKQTPHANKRFKYAYTYDGLNRLTQADYSYYTTSWLTTSAYDVTGIGYDAAGNLTALSRSKETGAVIDQLTYSYTAGTNRLASVADAIAATTETWDAEDGSFTYDAGGNVKTAPKPYLLTSVTYDHRSLPTQVVSNGNTTSYRYAADGQRYFKMTDGSEPGEHYALDGAVTLGVFSGTGTLRHWNLVAGDQVIGRYEGTAKKYYHKDLLGSTRAVTNVSGAVLETSDFYPLGLVMPTRSYVSGSATREKFTGKERDVETGLDYFGARYYMPALGRWTSVDPLAEKHPEWNPYNYVLGNPTRLIDPDGRQVNAADLYRGFSAAVTDNATTGAINPRGINAHEVTDARSYNIGQNIGDVFSAVVGVVEIVEGAYAAGGGTGLAVGSGGTLAVVGASVSAAGVGLAAHGTGMSVSGIQNLLSQDGRLYATTQEPTQGASGGSKPSIGAHKEALKQVHKEVGGSLPKGEPGKFGSPQRGTPQKGYRLDPGHPNRPAGDPEAGPHINWWDYTEGKRGSGGRSGAVPIKEE